ncbi:MAG: TlpA family protein disulfide reductase [Acidipila sp.]|nr:TlpA family protein disulfide reductase [Acidipila sp.]
MTTILAKHSAPSFELNDTRGKTISLAECLKKGAVVAAFFKVSCPVCQFTFPFLERLYKAYGSKGVTFLGISQDNKEDTLEFLKEHGVTFPTLIDQPGYAASNAYGLTNVPSIFLIGSDGKVLVSETGFDKKALEAISKEVAGQLGESAVAVFRPGEAIPDYKPG